MAFWHILLSPVEKKEVRLVFVTEARNSLESCWLTQVKRLLTERTTRDQKVVISLEHSNPAPLRFFYTVLISQC